MRLDLSSLAVFFMHEVALSKGSIRLEGDISHKIYIFYVSCKTYKDKKIDTILSEAW